MANAYKIIRYFQDVPGICKTTVPRTSETPEILDFSKTNRGSIFEFLALEVARMNYASDSDPITLKDFITNQPNVKDLEAKFNQEYSDIKMPNWGVA